MPIKDLTENVRLPRLGKIHLGTRHPEKGYPMKSDHFVFPTDHSDYKKLVELYGETAKELPVLIPVEDEETWSSQYYKAYNQTYGLVCKGDGEMAMRMVDVKTKELPDAKKAGTVTLQEMPCLGNKCPDYQAKKCHEVMNLRFILPEVPGLGVWQIDTGSKNSILNINSCAKVIKRAFGRVSMIPLNLTFEPIQVNTPETGKKQTVYTLNLRTDVTLAQLADVAREQSKTFMLEAPSIEDAFDVEVEKEIQEIWPEGETQVDKATGEVIEKPDTRGEFEKQGKDILEEAVEKTAKGEYAGKPDKSFAFEQEPLKEEAKVESIIDMDWLKESLETLGWSDCVKWLNSKYGTAGKRVSEIVMQLTPDQQKEFGQEVEERLELK